MRTPRPLAFAAPVALVALAVPVALTGACFSSAPPANEVVVVAIGDAPPVDSVGFAGGRLTLPVGIVQEIEVQSSEEDAGAIAVTADDPTRLSVQPMATPADFALVGIAQGSTTLRISIGGQQVPSFTVDQTATGGIPVDVTPALGD
jgi:hypothetical protein